MSTNWVGFLFLLPRVAAAAAADAAADDDSRAANPTGRGTSPEEGYAIAKATLERLARLGCRTLFATHFHRLAEEIGDDVPSSISNDASFNTRSGITRHTTKVILDEEEEGSTTAPNKRDVLEGGGGGDGSSRRTNPIFTFQVVPGTASSSYGIHCGRIAGMPEDVLRRAEEILRENDNKYR